MSKICQQCGRKRKSGELRCIGCGATDFSDEPRQQRYEGNPFFYNGYVVHWVSDIDHVMRQTVEHIFYLGDRLVERIIVDREVLDRFVPEGHSIMPFIWDLFKLAQGEEEALRIAEQNTIKPAAFKVTVEPSPEHEWLAGLTRHDVYEAVMEGERELTYRAQ